MIKGVMEDLSSLYAEAFAWLWLSDDKRRLLYRGMPVTQTRTMKLPGCTIEIQYDFKFELNEEKEHDQ